MLKIYDYLFYRIAFLFRQTTVIGDLNSIAIISIAETFNILAINNVVLNIRGVENDTDNNIFVGLLITFLLVGLNSIRFLWFKKYHELDFLWKEENKKRRFKRGIIILIYLLITIVFYVIS